MDGTTPLAKAHAASVMATSEQSTSQPPDRWFHLFSTKRNSPWSKTLDLPASALSC
jgi:hypothetical protein